MEDIEDWNYDMSQYMKLGMLKMHSEDKFIIPPNCTKEHNDLRDTNR